jgi:hypothetical protein
MLTAVAPGAAASEAEVITTPSNESSRGAADEAIVILTLGEVAEQEDEASKSEDSSIGTMAAPSVLRSEHDPDADCEPTGFCLASVSAADATYGADAAGGTEAAGEASGAAEAESEVDVTWTGARIGVNHS